ncbi:MAG: exfoliative toxin A/B [Colwellia sp.]|jgi:exfoliative toxin A/B
MFRSIKNKINACPTAMSGLALGIATLGWCWDNTPWLSGSGQLIGAVIASVLLIIITAKFTINFSALKRELMHPVIGSVIPTFSMGIMVVSNSLGKVDILLGDSLWLIALILHCIFLMVFAYHRVAEFKLHHLLPSWFVPPVGLIVAAVSFSGTPNLYGLAITALNFGLTAYAVLLPLMLYRLIFCEKIPLEAKPTIAILAAPASLCLAGYLSIIAIPSAIVVTLLAGIACLMTLVVYFSFFHLLRLPFSYGYAAFTFPMVISATALFKMVTWLETFNINTIQIKPIIDLAYLELLIASVIVLYVVICYAINLMGVVRKINVDFTLT